jgi:hypothetical protein
MNRPGGPGLMAIDASTQKMKRENSFNRTFDTGGIINSQVSGTL